MPYVDKVTKRKVGVDFLRRKEDIFISTAGELNYIITKFLKIYMRDRVKNYTLFNEVMGVLGSATAEFYRRVMVPYEDKKIEDNGDVY